MGVRLTVIISHDRAKSSRDSTAPDEGAAKMRPASAVLDRAQLPLVRGAI
jgi:hypothetical protein